jgi:hypothetical protein
MLEKMGGDRYENHQSRSLCIARRCPAYRGRLQQRKTAERSDYIGVDEDEGRQVVIL